MILFIAKALRAVGRFISLIDSFNFKDTRSTEATASNDFGSTRLSSSRADYTN